VIDINKIRKVGLRVWEVPSETKEGVIYSVKIEEKNGIPYFVCSCKGYQVHQSECKHIKAVKKWILQHQELVLEVV